MQSMWHGIGYVGDANIGLANFTVHLWLKLLTAHV